MKILLWILAGLVFLCCIVALCVVAFAASIGMSIDHWAFFGQTPGVAQTMQRLYPGSPAPGNYPDFDSAFAAWKTQYGPYDMVSFKCQSPDMPDIRYVPVYQIDARLGVKCYRGFILALKFH